jgi:hypothetical protein
MANITHQETPQQSEPPDEAIGGLNLTLSRLIYFSVAILIFQLVSGYLIYKAFGRWEDRSSFGSMFGAVGTLFSGLAFAGVVYAILLQRRDLELQRKEIKMNRQELKRSAAAQERAEQALTEQARMMELTAKLTAMNFLAEAYKNRIEFLEKLGRGYQQERDKLNEIILSMEELTHLL